MFGLVPWGEGYFCFELCLMDCCEPPTIILCNRQPYTFFIIKYNKKENKVKKKSHPSLLETKQNASPTTSQGAKVQTERVEKSTDQTEDLYALKPLVHVPEMELRSSLGET